MVCLHCKPQKGKYLAAGQMFREYTCIICNKKQWHENTNIPQICFECKKESVCRWCLDGMEKK